jgi:predicted nucleic-acid-binding protein
MDEGIAEAVEDDLVQTDRAEAVLRSGDVLLLKTVLLEAAWVLRATYRFDRSAIGVGLRRLAGLPGIEVEDAEIVAQAFSWFDQGLDFADSLHLASSGGADAFVSFDRTLRRRARLIADAPPVALP